MIPKLPNEIFALICSCLEPELDEGSPNINTLLALRSVCQATRRFATPMVFRRWRLGGGRGQEESHREALIASGHPISEHVERLVVDVDSMIPGFILDQLDPPEGKPRRSFVDVHGEHNVDDVEQISAHARVFRDILTYVFSICHGRVRTLELAEDSRISNPRVSGGKGDRWLLHYVTRFDAWRVCFWQAISCAFSANNHAFPRLTSLELWLRNFDRVWFLWRKPKLNASRKGLVNCFHAYDASQWQSFADNKNGVVPSLRNIRNVSVSLYGVRMFNTWGAQRITEPHGGVQEFCEGFLLPQSRIDSLVIDFDLPPMVDKQTAISPLITSIAPSKWTRLNKLNLIYFIEGSDRYLIRFLTACTGLRRLGLYQCTITRDTDDGEDGTESAPRWADIFETCDRELKDLTDLSLEGLRYYTFAESYHLPVNVDPLMREMWRETVYTDVSEDSDSFYKLVGNVARRRKERGMSENEWLNMFSRKPDRWETIVKL